MKTWTIRAGLLMALAGCSNDPTSIADAAGHDDAQTPARDALTSGPDAEPTGRDAEAGDTDGGFAGEDRRRPDGGTEYGIATPGQRCEYWRRRGVIDIEDGWANVSLFDKAPPFFGAPELQDDACLFHRASTATCGGGCAGDRVCSFGGSCVAPQVPAPSVALTVTGASDAQTFRGDGSGFNGQITLPDTALSLRLVAGDLQIDVPTMSAPDELIRPAGRLTGTSSAPRAADVTWTAPANDGVVYSLTNINHHVGTPTFTECVVPASAGRLHIDGAMLAPLAVATGLEFQALQHTNFAAVQVGDGCIEVRFTRRQYVSLEK